MTKKGSHFQSINDDNGKFLDTNVAEDGWGEDDDEWSFEDDGFDHCPENVNGNENGTENGNAPVPSPPPPPPPPPFRTEDRVHRIYLSLCEYMDYLHHPELIPAVNECFHDRVNSSSASSELVDYYESRPRLRAYTLETELPRMSYTVLPADGSTPLTDVEDIRHRYLHEHNGNSDDDLIWRAANQSLLADAISALTYGLRPPLLRNDLLVTSTAHRCHFELVLGEGGHLTCLCELSIRSPNTTLATLSLRILLAPSRRILECRATDVTVTPPDQITHDDLRRMAAEIARDTIDGPDDPSHQNHHYHQHHHQPTSFRDSLVSNTSEGLRSALDQVDTVVNVQSKWKFLQSVLPSLPTAELLEEAERESEAVMVERYADDDDRKENHALYRKNDRDSGENDGIHLYHKDDEDANIHQGNGATNGPEEAQDGVGFYNREMEQNEPTLQLYRKDEKVLDDEQENRIHLMNDYVKEPVLQLYRKNEEPSLNAPDVEEEGLQLNRRDVQHQPKQVNTTTEVIPPVKTRSEDLASFSHREPLEEMIEEGWSDDEDDLELDDEGSDAPWTKPEEGLCMKEDYAIKMDVVETRKRWIRPIVSMGSVRF